MQYLVAAVLPAIVVATAIATGVTLAPGTRVRTWVRRIFLVLINLSPWTIGTWRKEFSARETFLAAWFLSFVAILIGLAFAPRNFLTYCNNRLERSRGRIFDEPRRESMIWINQLRLASTHSSVAPHC